MKHRKNINLTQEVHTFSNDDDLFLTKSYKNIVQNFDEGNHIKIFRVVHVVIWSITLIAFSVDGYNRCLTSLKHEITYYKTKKVSKG